MKIFLITLVTLVLNQNVFATPLEGAGPNLSKGAAAQAEAGSTFQSAVAKDGQPAICEKCEENKKAMLSNNVGVQNWTGEHDTELYIQNSQKVKQQK